MDSSGKPRNHPKINFSQGSGGVFSQDPRLIRVGWGTACLKQEAELKALVVLAESMNGALLFEVRVDAKCTLTSIARPARAKRGVNGNLW